ncbi:MAG: (Fe-S)-binding protein, partial [Nitrospirota bacterium]
MIMTRIIQPLDIYKKMPRTNCGRCTAGSCMAFA